MLQKIRSQCLNILKMKCLGLCSDKQCRGAVKQKLNRFQRLLSLCQTYYLLDSINRHWHRSQLQVGKNRRRTMSERNGSEWESVCLGASGPSLRLDVRDLSNLSHHLSIFPSPSTHTVCSDSQSTCCSSNSADWAHEVWENSPSQGQEDFESHYHLHIC